MRCKTFRGDDDGGKLADLLGSVVATADTAGGTRPGLPARPVGRPAQPGRHPFTGNGGAVTHGYTGHEHDDPLGLINMKGLKRLQ